MRNRFKGLDLIVRVPEDYVRRFVTLYRRQGSRTPQRKRNAKKAKCLWEEALQIAEKRVTKTKEKRKDIHIGMQSSKE